MPLKRIPQKQEILVWFSLSTKELYGVEGLERLVRQNGSLSAREMQERIIADVQAFTGKTEQHDDMTVVVVRVL